MRRQPVDSYIAANHLFAGLRQSGLQSTNERPPSSESIREKDRLEDSLLTVCSVDMQLALSPDNCKLTYEQRSVMLTAQESGWKEAWTTLGILYATRELATGEVEKLAILPSGTTRRI